VEKISKEKIYILGIESSCDETAAAIVANGREVCSGVIASQIAIHQPYGGVVPEIASRCHLEAIAPVVDQALKEADLTFAQIDAVAVSSGPGLVGALLVGVSYAKALAQALNIPLIAVHHWQGHMAAVFLEHNPSYPFVALVVSGSHTGIVFVEEKNDYLLLGSSRDDAAGEAFDKIARALGLGYPGGPLMEKAALGGDINYFPFPRAWLKGSYDFSFSGLKSAVWNYLNQRKMKNDPVREEEIPHLAASTQEAIVEVLANKTIEAAREYGVKNIVLAGGVAANRRLRELFALYAPEMNLYAPSLVYCTDNAAMIASAAYDKWLEADFADLSLNADPRQNLYCDPK